MIAFTATDSGGSGVNFESIAAVVDGLALAVGPWASPSFEAQARGLADGLHGASISLADNAGNSTTVPFTIAVDTIVPVVANLSPAEGDVTNASPKISLDVADGTGSGINPSASRFILTNRVTASTLRPSLNAGALSYQVPLTAVGANLGEGPLPPGFYTVDAFIQDLAGNESHLSAFFTVLLF
ncbi:MAG: hypothetical protein ABR548_10130 [Actinomycetota bacterium]|nr:hypothetical protein [Actinomycetota bacterium]